MPRWWGNGGKCDEGRMALAKTCHSSSHGFTKDVGRGGGNKKQERSPVRKTIRVLVVCLRRGCKGQGR